MGHVCVLTLCSFRAIFCCVYNASCVSLVVLLSISVMILGSRGRCYCAILWIYTYDAFQIELWIGLAVARFPVWYRFLCYSEEIKYASITFTHKWLWVESAFIWKTFNETIDMCLNGIIAVWQMNSGIWFLSISYHIICTKIEQIAQDR